MSKRYEKICILMAMMLLMLSMASFTASAQNSAGTADGNEYYVTVSVGSLNLITGGSQKISVTSMASGDSVKQWSSSNSAVVSVSRKKGTTVTVKGKKQGYANITVTLKSGLKHTIPVTVRKNAVTFNPSTSYVYGEGGGLVSKLKSVSYTSSGFLKASFLFINSSSSYINKLDRIDISIANGERTIASQQFKNVSLKLSAKGGTKTVTFIFRKGTKVKNSNLVSGTIGYSVNWMSSRKIDVGK